MARLVLARHGETPWNRERRVQGWAPVGLSETGREQARCLGQHLATAYDPDRLRCSDLRRAVETARLVGREFEDAPRPVGDPVWRERDFGVLQGLGYDALFEGYPEFAVSTSGRAAAEATPEGGESWLDLRDRVLGAAGELLAAMGPDDTAVVVTHGGPIRHLLGAARGLDVVERVGALDPPNCSVTELVVGVPEGWEPATPTGAAPTADARQLLADATVECAADAAFVDDPPTAD